MSDISLYLGRTWTHDRQIDLERWIDSQIILWMNLISRSLDFIEWTEMYLSFT